MSKKIRDVLIKHPYLCLGLTVLGGYTIVYLGIALSGHTSVFYGDMTLQVIQTAQHCHDLIHDGLFSFWDEAIGLGGPTSIHFWTFLTSPSFWIYVIFPDSTWFIHVLPMINTIRAMVLTVLGYKYLSYFLNKDQWMLYFGSLLFSSFGYTNFFIHYPYFADFMIYTVLLMICSEQIIQQHRGYFSFALVIGLTSLSNLYNIYMNCWFLLVYLLFRMSTLDGMTIKLFIRYFIRFFLFILLGIGISAVVFIPNIISLLSNNRVGIHELTMVKTIKDTYGLITAFISPILNDFDYNIYLSYTANGDVSPFAYVYTSILVITTVFNGSTTFKWKKPLLITLIVLCLISLTPLSNLIFCGDPQSNRWVYFICLFKLFRGIAIAIQSTCGGDDDTCCRL